MTPLTPAAVRDLTARSRAGDVGARNSLVTANLGLARSIAARYTGRGLDRADLDQAGAVGLIRAAERFDPARAVRFSTYASFWVRKEIFDALEFAGVIRVPKYLRAALAAERDGRPAGVPTNAACLGAARRARAAGPLDADAGGPHEPAATEPDAPAYDPEDVAWLAAARRDAGLTARERYVVRSRFDRGETLAAAAARLGVSREAVHMTQRRAIRKLRAAYRPVG